MKIVYYFTASWCNPCKKIKPIFQELINEYLDINFKMIDVDSEIELAKSFGIKSIPTFILLKDNVQIKRISGAQTKEKLVEFLLNEI